jgi:hypothetical protein
VRAVYGRMLGQKVLPAILSPASIALLSVQTTVVEAASNECKAKPDSAAPAGSRWYYRVSRVDQSRCWFLSSRDVSVHSRLSQTATVTRSHVTTPTSEAPVTQQDRQIGPQIASAIEPAEEQLALGQTIVPQMAVCHEYRRSIRRYATVREMKEDPSRSAIRC